MCLAAFRHVHALGAFCQEECLQRHSDSHRARVACEALRNPLGCPKAAQPWSQGLLRQWTARRGPALSRSDSSLNKWPRSGRVSVLSWPQQPSEVRGSMPWKGGQKGIQAGCGSGHVGSWHLWSSIPRCLLRGYFLSLTLSVYFCVTNVCFIFSGPLSSISSINTSRSGQDK